MAAGGVIQDDVFVINVTGATTTGVKARVYVPWNIEVQSVHTAVGTAPTGATLIVDVEADAVTLFTTQANRPTIAISAFETALAGAVPDVKDVAGGAILTVAVDQIGSTVAGADLTVTIVYRYDTD